MSLVFQDYIQEKPDRLSFILLSERTTRTVFTYEILGDGGALHISGARVNIRNTFFVNNTASGDGGSILITKEATVQVFNVHMVTTGSYKVGSSHGAAICSQAYLTLSNVSIRVLSSSSHVLSTLYHQKSGRQDSLRIVNFDIICPSKVRLSVQNSSVAIFRSTSVTPQRYRSYRGFICQCAACPLGFYTMETGSLAIWGPPPLWHKIAQVTKSIDSVNTNNSLLNGNTSPGQQSKTNDSSNTLETKDRNYYYTEVTCSTCPFGGICNGTLQAKPNYWGKREEDGVKMYRCPPSYCCTTSCGTYNQCTRHRGGTLCGRCLPGYGEAMFSTKCIPFNQCTDQWFLLILSVCLFSYTAFLLFQNDLKIFLVGKPIGKKTFVNKIRQANVNQTSKEKETDLNSEKRDEGGIFLILLFYYFQDASIIHFDPIYKDNASQVEAAVRQIVYGLFKFKIDVLHFAKTVCIFENMTPISKLFLNVITVPMVWVILMVIYVVFRLIGKKRKITPVWFIRCTIALMLSILFSYQKTLSSLFDSIYCVEVNKVSVLFLDGTIECFTFVQWVAVIILSSCTIPFTFYITFAPGLLGQSKVSTKQFLIGCFFPLPVALYNLCTRNHEANDQQPKTASCSALHTLLQGPYKVLYWPGTKVTLCWSGILLFRRLALILVYTLVQDSLMRLSIMSPICLLWQLTHVAIQPCKEKRANLSGTISCTALLTIAAINTIKATFESMEIVPAGQTLSIMETLESIEDCLLIWIPLAGICLIFLTLILRLFVYIWSYSMANYNIKINERNN